jgi:S1-C subfamily serine protease
METNVRLKLFIALLPVLLAAGRASAASLQSLRSSVFKIIVVSNEPSFSEPWKRQPSSTSSGTGFYIGNGRIMTNAHVVANGSFISILRDGDARPVPAYVEFVAHDADLAVIVPKEREFLKKLTPMHFGSLPRLMSPVATIGFPTGGEQISITEGVVSRISYRRYVHHGKARHLLVQVDSAINPGNSGGPVVQGRRVVGVAFQSFTAAENTGYIIPTPVIERFLKDIEDGSYDGHQEDGLMTMDWSLNNSSTSDYHGVDARAPKGVTVTHVAPFVPAFGEIRAGDVLTAIDNIEIGVDGKITFQGERVDFRTIYDLKQLGETASFELIREGAKKKVSFRLDKLKPHHDAVNVYAKNPRFFVYGGLVYTTLSRSYLRTWGEKWYREAPLLLRFLDAYAPMADDFADMDEFIVLAKRLPDAVNQHASGNQYGILTRVNGQPVRSIESLISLVEKAAGPFLLFEFFGSNEPLVLSVEDVRKRNPLILAKYGVTPDRWLAGPEVDGALMGDGQKEATP